LNIIFLAGLDMGIIGYVLATVLADLLTTVLVFVAAKLHRAFVPKKINGRVMKELLKFCLPLVPSTIFWWITGVSDRYMIAWMCSAQLNGLYTAAYKVPNLLIYAISIFDSAWKLSVASEENPEARSAFYSRVWRVYTTLAFLGGGGLILCARFLAKILFAAGFEEAWVYIPTLTFATVFTALCTFLSSIYFVSRKTMGSMLTAMGGAVLNILLNLLLIPRFGAMGASVATFAAYFFVCILRMATTYGLVSFRREWGRGAVNTMLLGALTLVITLSERNATRIPLMYGGAILILILMLAVNAKPLVELARDAKGMLRRR
jgi:O-antigen/teichoic acid export membrane protein